MKRFKLKFTYLIALVAVFSIGFQACDNDDDDDDNKGPEVTQQDRDFANSAVQANTAEIRFGELALQRASHDTIIAFATRMIMDHAAAREELDSIAGLLDINVADSMDVAHRTLYQTLSGLDSMAFDSAYIVNQVIDHQNSLDLHQEQVDDGNNDRLINFARRQVQIINMHLENAIAIRDSVILRDTVTVGR